MADVTQQMYGPPLIEVMHYDFADDLNVWETLIIDSIAKEAARLQGVSLHHTLRPRFYTAG